MRISLEDMLITHDGCVARLDENKRCTTCKHEAASVEVEPCVSCYYAMLGFPVNPTNWEAEEQGDA